MHPLIRFAAALILLSLAALSVLASPNSSSPAKGRVLHIRQIKKLYDFLPDSMFFLSTDKKAGPLNKKSGVVGDRICSCQVLNLESSNYDHRFVVLLAEKTNDGTGAGFKTARKRIQKEKKQMKELFYDKVKLVAELNGIGSCKSMYFRLRMADSNLQLYEILNAD